MFKSLLKMVLAAALSVLFGACQKRTEEVHLSDTHSVKGHFMSFDRLEGWQEDDHGLILKMFQQECTQGRLPPSLKNLCVEAEHTKEPRHFFEENFRPFLLQGGEDEEQLLTGYYEPEFKGALRASERYRVPLYRRPKDLIVVDLASLYPELKKYKLRGRMKQGRIIPYYSRAEINAGMLKERPLCYLESDIDRFFLQVQGSGRVRLNDDKTMFVGYDGQNGHPYHSIGKALVASGTIPQEKISLQSIRAWLEDHPAKAKTVLESNPSFVFFGERKRGASGALGLELTAMRSVAVDRSKIPLGSLLFLEATNPVSDRAIRQTVLAQDTGGAIKGQVRADLFCGFGKDAERLAGTLQSELKLYLLLPKDLAEE